MKRELFPEFLEDADKKMAARNVAVRPAATLLLIDREGKTPRLLVGIRKSTLAFMPGLTVFPGGAVDEADAKMVSADELSKETIRRLRFRASLMSRRGARGLALAAIRELYEETGLMYGKRISSPRRGEVRRGALSEARTGRPHPNPPPAGEGIFPDGWEDFSKHGVIPTLSNLHLVARAVTPPYRLRRFDTRFFLGDKQHIAKTIRLNAETDLEKIEWLSLDQIFKRPLAYITRQVLTDLAPLLQRNNPRALSRPFPFYYARGKKYFCETIG